MQDFALTHQDDPSSDRDLGYSYFYTQDYQEAINLWQEEQPVPEGWPGWLRFPLEIEYLSRLGATYALNGDSLEAKKMIEKIQDIQSEHPDLAGVQAYYTSRIYAHLGRKEAGHVTSLAKSLKLGFNFFRPSVFSRDAFLYFLKRISPLSGIGEAEGINYLPI